MKKTKTTKTELETARDQVVKLGAQLTKARFFDHSSEEIIAECRARFEDAMNRFDALTFKANF